MMALQLPTSLGASTAASLRLPFLGCARLFVLVRLHRSVLPLNEGGLSADVTSRRGRLVARQGLVVFPFLCYNRSIPSGGHIAGWVGAERCC